MRSRGEYPLLSQPLSALRQGSRKRRPAVGVAARDIPPEAWQGRRREAFIQEPRRQGWGSLGRATRRVRLRAPITVSPQQEASEGGTPLAPVVLPEPRTASALLLARAEWVRPSAGGPIDRRPPQRVPRE